MSSINTNLSAMTALQALKSTQNAMNKNQNQISTGLRVGEASHNASYWSISTQMKSDNGALGAVKDSIKQSKAMINTFTSAMDKTLGYLNKMKEGLVAARQPGADLAKIQSEFDAHIAGMKSAASSAQFNGQNWLAQATAGMVELVTSYDGKNNSVGTLAIDTSKTNLFTDAAAGTGGLLGNAAAVDIGPVADSTAGTGGGSPTAGKAVFDLTKLDIKAGAKFTFAVDGGAPVEIAVAASWDADSNGTFTGSELQAGLTVSGATVAFDGTSKLTITSSTTGTASKVTASYGGPIKASAIDTALSTIDTAIAKVTEGSAMLGANKALLETQEEFIGVLSDSITAGVSAFIDADMNEASTRNQALQTQQQLGVQALSMANQNSQMILKLFQ